MTAEKPEKSADMDKLSILCKNLKDDAAADFKIVDWHTDAKLKELEGVLKPEK